MNFDDLLKNIPVGDIAEKLGVDKKTAESAIQQAVPALLGGMTVNAQSSEGAKSLEKALANHEAKVDLNAVDPADGEKILGHVFGDKKTDVVSALGQQNEGGMGDLIGKLLPILAPIVMGLLANGMSKGSATSNQTSQSDSSGGIGDLLGGLLGGGSTSNSGGGLGDLLGGLLGGGGGKNDAGGLGDLLGGLLGGKR